MTGSDARAVGFHHAVGTYRSDHELLDLVVGHLETGLHAGEPVFAALAPDETALVRAALAPDAGVTYWPALQADARPAAVVKGFTELAERLGGERAHVVQAVPHPGTGAPWDGWCRYEAAINDLFGPLALSGLCLYDRRITPAPVLAEIEATHPHVMTPDGRQHLNGQYQRPAEFLRSRPPVADPAEAEPPALELVDPTPAIARGAVREVAGRSGAPPDAVDQLVLATSEAVTNALVHGRPPVRLRAWPAAGRVVVTVKDGGPGPDNPFVGLVPAPDAETGRGGYGLWLVEQMVTAAHVYADDGFTLRLVAGPARRPGADA